MHRHIRERRNTHLCKLKHPNFTVPKHTNVVHDWQVLMARWLFMLFSYDFIVLPLKKSDMSMRYKRSS